MPFARLALAVLLVVSLAPHRIALANAGDDTPAPPVAVAKKVAGMERIDGYVPLYWDANTGKLFMEISRFDSEFLYQVSLATGVGSNPVGLDKGQLGAGRVVAFRRIGPRVLLIQRNYEYRATSDNPAER